jgi:hypothetical protein
MDLSIIVQTCDKYEKYWPGFFYYMDKFWDKKINSKIYFCNEKKQVNKPGYEQILTGSGTFIENLKFILSNIKSKYVFYMLEDFWPLCSLDSNLFESIYKFIENNNIKAFQLSSYTPYYDILKTDIRINDQNIFKFKSNSKWRFNFQTRFWDRELLLNSLLEPKISEKLVRSAITAEMECDNNFDKNIDIYFYHYFWYPLTGVSYRGEFTSLGEELQNNMMVDLFSKNI